MVEKPREAQEPRSDKSTLTLEDLISSESDVLRRIAEDIGATRERQLQLTTHTYRDIDS